MTPRARLIVVVRPGRSAGRAGDLARWIRKLLPAAILLVTPAAVPPELEPDVITLDADDVVSGPLSLADELVRLAERASG